MLWGSILVQYLRMSGTVMIAVVLRMTLDAIGIVVVGQDADKEDFWFARCKQRKCVVVGMSELIICVLGASAFVLLANSTLLKNKWSRLISPALIIGAVEWMPISVGGGKTNMIMGYFIDIIKFTSTGWLEGILFALLLNTIAALFATLNLNGRQDSTLSARGYLNFTRLLILYAISWAVGWAYWDSTLRFLDAITDSVHPVHPLVNHVVLTTVIVAAASVYLKFGPEPVVPQHSPVNFSISFWRCFISFAVYSSVVLLVMVLSDPAYGFLHLCCISFYPQYVYPHATLEGFSIFCFACTIFTLFSVTVSSAVTHRYGVDMFSSIRLSRHKKQTSQATIRAYFEDPSLLSLGSETELNPITIGCCLIYDVMVLATACMWGQVCLGGLSLFRPLIDFGAIPYLFITFMYSAAFIFVIPFIAVKLSPRQEQEATSNLIEETKAARDIRGEMEFEIFPLAEMKLLGKDNQDEK